MNQLFNPSKALHGDAWQARARAIAAVNMAARMSWNPVFSRAGRARATEINLRAIPDAPDLGKTWGEMARAAGVSVSSLKRWARRLGANKAQVRLNIAVQASRAFEV